MNVQTIKFNETSFISVTDPGELEIKYLKNNFGFSSLDLDDYLNNVQIPKVESLKNHMLLILDFPRFTNSPTHTLQKPPEKNEKAEKTEKKAIQKLLDLPQNSLPVPLPQFPVVEKKRRVITSQVYFYVGKDYLVILHDGKLAPINDIFTLCQSGLTYRSEYMAEGPVFLAYRIIDALVDSCFPIMNDLSAIIDKIDRDIDDNKSSELHETISVTRRNIVVFQTMIKPVIPLFKQLEDGKHKELNGRMQPFWGNVLDHLSRLWDRLEDSRELIEGISRSYESLIASRTNEVILLLTIFSAIILPLNLFASIYGMNIEGLPYAHDPLSFPLLTGLMIIISVIMLLIFKFRRWF